ncbi:hypothetical protein [Embleya sp. NBC_00896]|uniref:hypothetical protein n=1 Tax=Embleya sp. NBC_00896 TaxID=2975961 RepID=UPI002F90FE1A|nr:hypothetical protein OG928_40050 [Embleya sp. NBC_00896]
MSLSVPASWYEFDLHPATRDDNIRRAVAARVRELPELAERRGDLVRALRTMAGQAWDAGAIYCGCLAEEIEGIQVSATMTMAAASLRGPDGELSDGDPRAIAAQLKPKRQEHPQDTWQSVRTVEITDVGTVARSEGVTALAASSGRSVRLVSMQTFVPIPGITDRVAVISGSSPTVELADPMLELFDAITSTFRFDGVGTRA